MKHLQQLPQGKSMIKLPKRAVTVFLKVVRNALRQKTQCKKNKACAYRDKRKRCFAGWLIKSEDYRKKFEGSSWLELVRSGYISKSHRNLVNELQCIHDAYTGNFNGFMEYAIPELREISERLGCNKTFEKIVKAAS